MRIAGFATMIARARTVGDDLMDLCYPPACGSCERPASAGRWLCDDCDARLATLETAPACGRCAMPLATDGAPCPWCEGDGLRPYDRVVRLGEMADPLKHLVHRAKYAAQWPVAERLADRLAATDRARAVLAQTDVLVPVPLHGWRHVRRGFNQADVIARRLARAAAVDAKRDDTHASTGNATRDGTGDGSVDGIATGERGRRGPRVVYPVVRLRATETQTHLRGRANRAANLKDAFGLVRPQDVAGRRVTVVDDVLTTGATLVAVARALKPAGPASLSAITLAIADPESRAFEVI